MRYYMPTMIYAEENCVASHSEALCSMGTRALIVTGRTSAEKNGSLADVKEALEKGGVAYSIFNGIEENPSTETVMKARDFGLAEGVDFVIGIGGGSPMDAAKAIALMIRNKDRDISFLYESGNSDALPIALVPTTCGTGSEATAISVLTRHEKKTKSAIPHELFGRYAFLDGKYLASMPAHTLADTTMDAFAHLTESYINSSANDFSRMCVDAGLKIWGRSKDVILGKKEASTEDYTNMLNAAAIAGMSIAQTGTSLPHGLSYALTYNAGLPHGNACGYFLAGYMKEASPEYSEHVLTAAGFGSIEEFAEYYAVTCDRRDASVEYLETAVREVGSNPAKLAKAPFDADEDTLRRIAGL